MNELQELAEHINGMEFEHVFTLHPDGSITEPVGIWAPYVYDDPDTDIHIDSRPGDEWSALTGLTGQDSYHGAIMHPSEFIGRGIASYMQGLADEEPVTYVVTVVYDSEDAEPIGWAILMRKEAT